MLKVELYLILVIFWTKIKMTKKNKEEEKFVRCWTCDVLISKNRAEEHHVFGKEVGKKIFLCRNCHDLIDRYGIGNFEVFKEFFINLLKELEELPRGKCKFVKLMMLRMIKCQQ